VLGRTHETDRRQGPGCTVWADIRKYGNSDVLTGLSFDFSVNGQFFGEGGSYQPEKQNEY